MKVQQKPRVPFNYALGIDAGVASVGWAVVELNDDREPVCLHSAGIRRFEAGVEGDFERGRDESLSTARRQARGTRRQTWRRQRRLRKVFRTLQRGGLLPASAGDDHDGRHQVFQELDTQLKLELSLSSDRVEAHLFPYTLRALALDQPLSPHALGRALYHLAQRRGFLSNLKAGRGDEEQGQVKKGISELSQAIEAVGARTLGEYFSQLDPEEQRIRRRWTARKMYRDEFAAIWAAQAPHHAALTEEFKSKLEEAIFHQRPLKSQQGLIGRCDLESYKRRIPAAALPFQRFRLLQRVNDLTVQCPDGEVRRLNEEERKKLIEELEATGDMSWPKLRKLLGMKKSKEYGRDYEFNFEQGGEKKLVGNRTAAKMQAALGDAWTALDEPSQTALVDDILRFEDEDELADQLRKRWKLDNRHARTLVDDVSPEPGYGSLSRRAIRKLLPHLEQGVQYATARDLEYPEAKDAKEPEPFLPPFAAVAKRVRNPAVTRTMAELRKVVNALIREHGKPAYIRIELARDLKNSRDRRKKAMDQRDRNTKSRDQARARILQELGEKYVTPGNILKLRLADECNWQCPYTGRAIKMESLIGEAPQFDVEHIIPFSRSLDNSFANKTLCYHEENRNKKAGSTPFQAFGASSDWAEMVKRVGHFQGDASRRKLDLFQREKLLEGEDFTERQLSDTRYLSRAAADYVAVLYGGRYDADGKLRVQASPGGVTKFLRDAWDLNRIVGDPDDPLQKNRADHRHHAIDAFLVAVSTPAIVKALNEAAAKSERLGTRHLLVDVDPPWEGFDWADVGEVVERIVVSSRVNRKLNGALHKETILSKPHQIADCVGKTKTVHHVRKPLGAMSRGEIDAIVDPAIRTAVIDKLEKIGGDPKKAFADPSNHPYLTAKDGRIIPIHRARIQKPDATIPVGAGSRTRFVTPGDNHHMEVVAVLDPAGGAKKWEGKPVTRYEAMRRWRAGESVVKKEHGSQRKFLFSLTGGECLLIPAASGSPEILRVTVISGQQIEFVPHTDARPITIRKKIPGARIRYAVDRLRMLNARKVNIDPLGRITPARD